MYNLAGLPGFKNSTDMHRLIEGTKSNLRRKNSASSKHSLSRNSPLLLITLSATLSIGTLFEWRYLNKSSFLIFFLFSKSVAFKSQNWSNWKALLLCQFPFIIRSQAWKLAWKHEVSNCCNLNVLVFFQPDIVLVKAKLTLSVWRIIFSTASAGVSATRRREVTVCKNIW